jgi:capsular exopolysaccharide synthesis family protein
MSENGPHGGAPARRAQGLFPADGIQLIEYWRVLVQRRHLLLTVVGAAVVLGAAVTFTMTPEYRATATLQVERQGPEILTYQDVLSVDPSHSAYQNFYQTQYKILQSRAVLAIAAERLDLVHRPEYAGRRRSPLARIAARLRGLRSGGRDGPDANEAAVEFLGGGLSIQPIRNSHLVRVVFTDRRPDLARDVANAIAAAYQEFNLDARYSATAQASEFLTKQVAQLQLEIAEMERQLQEYSASKEILALRDDTQDITTRALGELSAQHVRAKGRLAIARAHYESVLHAPPESFPEVMQSPLIAGLRQQYAESERRRSQMAERFHEGWPALQQLDEELAQARERLELETEKIAAQVRSVAKKDVDRAIAEQQNLSLRVDDQKSEVQRVNLDAIDVASLQSEIDAKRSFLDELVSRQSQTEMSDRLRDTRASNMWIVDEAETPRSPVRPRKLLNMLFSVVIGLFLGIGVAFVVDHLDNTIKTEADIERVASVPVFGHVPLFQPLRAVASDATGSPEGRSDDPVGLASHLDPRSVFAEAFKNLRTSILLASPDHPPRLIVVTSCEPSDGKSTVSVNLAIVLTQLGHRVLLVDADLRRPRLHKILGVENDVGLSSLITGNASFAELLHHTAIPNLTLVTSGPVPPNPSELLESSTLQSMLVDLSQPSGFDHVIFDSPPTVQVADSVILAAKTDATIVVARAGKTARESLGQGIARLRQARVHVAGTVLNAVNEQSSYYYGRYRYYRSDSDESLREPRRLKGFRRRSRSA